MKNSSERKRYKTNPNFDAYLLYSYIQMKRNASDKISRDKADKLIYEYLNNYIMYELYYSYRSTLEKCEFQELYQSLWVEVLADLPRFNPDLGRATTFFRYSIKHALLETNSEQKERTLLLFEDVNIQKLLGVERIKEICAFPIRFSQLEAAPVAMVAITDHI